MVSEKQERSNQDEAVATGVTGKVVLVAFLGGALLVFLSLVSHHPSDADYLAGGMDGYVIRNWIGYVGAAMSWLLLLVLGFAAYPAAVLLLVSFGRRLFWRRGLRPVGWDYWGAFFLVGVGLAMLFGIWPSLWQDAAARLNISQLPGGVVGQLLCSPGVGWMRVILNPAGSAIVAATLILIGGVVLWSHDWHQLAVQALRSLRERLAGEVGPLPAVRPPRREPSLRERLGERLEARRAQRELRKQRKPGVTEEKPAPRGSAAAPEESTPAQPELPAPAESGVKSVLAAKRKPSVRKYQLPKLELLNEHFGDETTVDAVEIETKKAILQATLDSFGIDAEVGEATSGPRVTLFEVLPAPGVKVERISRISNNIAMELRALSLRILTPIPGRNSVGIEVPNAKPATVSLRNLMSATSWSKSRASIPLLLGRNISGREVVLDLARAPHLLIAGATGSGKSVCINALIMSLLYRFTPEELRLILVDPKVVEFSCYQTLPHLVVPVITESSKVPLALRWIINEMEHRYRIFAKVGARNITSFNERPRSDTPVLDDAGEEIEAKVPYIVLIIDELADIMMTAKGEVETSLARIAQLSRAVGIHTIIATQRPSVNVITGTIKANYPTRIAFQVTSQVDARTILDGKGAESLLGRGDMLYRPPGASNLERNQSALVEDDEIENVVRFCAGQAAQEFDMGVFKGGDGAPGAEMGLGEAVSEADEELIEKAVEVILRDRRPTTSYVQRSLRIGYNRAALIMEILEQRGIIGPQVGSAPREILIDHRGGNDDIDGIELDEDPSEEDLEIP